MREGHNSSTTTAAVCTEPITNKFVRGSAFTPRAYGTKSGHGTKLGVKSILNQSVSTHGASAILGALE